MAFCRRKVIIRFCFFILPVLMSVAAVLHASGAIAVSSLNGCAQQPACAELVKANLAPASTLKAAQFSAMSSNTINYTGTVATYATSPTQLIPAAFSGQVSSASGVVSFISRTAANAYAAYGAIGLLDEWVNNMRRQIHEEYCTLITSHGNCPGYEVVRGGRQ